jgi:hypothetical protein
MTMCMGCGKRERDCTCPSKIIPRVEVYEIVAHRIPLVVHDGAVVCLTGVSLMVNAVDRKTMVSEPVSKLDIELNPRLTMCGKGDRVEAELVIRKIKGPTE